MKKIAFISVPLMAISFLVGCGGGGQPAPKQYIVTVTSEDTSKGTVSGGGSYTSGSSVTINASPSAGYKFEGWYDQSSKISPLVSYTFTMPASDVSYVAKFDIVKPWYQKNDWWNYCSSGVVGEQAIDADIGKK